MSSTDTHQGHGHGGEHPHDDGVHMPHGTRKSYITGFVLSVILTAIPFILVMAGGFASGRLTAFVVLAFAVVQIVVHMVYFLHMSPKSEGGWSLVSLVFTLIVLVIALVGTMWVMYHMDANMMPGMATMPSAGEN
ncbi:cytochrome o ubiquinol oxidase subunit IV [Paracoccus pacificus]|uniref:Cytochrome bo(3) ubiquinol oxidase subunit 4 n=1 Tax=Paracoccus pacificus TaxID=1463598 RepID=A0ABW4R4K4_9RHOB